MLEYRYEDLAAAKGYRRICGVDEAGRGPLAGPVCAAAVILPEGLTIEGLNDSKKLSAAKREKLADIIRREAVAYSVRMVDCETIDRVNILNATFMAMLEAMETLNPAADYALIDGNRLPPGLWIPGECVIGGDAISPSIAAASILAKVERDRYMAGQEDLYPGYGFAKHKGYGTKEHVASILELGPCPIHRRSFLRNIL